CHGRKPDGPDELGTADGLGRRPGLRATRVGPSRAAAVMARNPLTAIARVAWSVGQAISEACKQAGLPVARSRWVMGRLAWDHATVRKNRSWLSPVWNLGCRAE